MIRYVLIAVGALLILDTMAVAAKVPFNTGTVMPAILGFPLLLWGLVLPHLDEVLGPAWASGVQWLLVAAYSLFLILFGAISFWIIRAKRRTEAESEPADVMVVLGSRLNGDQVGRTLAMRLDKAMDILKAQPGLPVIVSGGQSPGDPVAEAEAMARYLIYRGIDEDRIRMEAASVNTYENLTFSQPIARMMTGLEDPRLLIVTSGLHLYRAGLIAAGAGIRTSAAGSADARLLMPNMLLREMVAVVKYHLLGY